jgi:hypothetical protein
MSRRTELERGGAPRAPATSTGRRASSAPGGGRGARDFPPRQSARIWNGLTPTEWTGRSGAPDNRPSRALSGANCRSTTSLSNGR